MRRCIKVDFTITLARGSLAACPALDCIVIVAQLRKGEWSPDATVAGESEATRHSALGTAHC